jgi:outer membrane protein assembly factor BamE (lipoprotein component of BamABCDE complex)
MHSHRNIPALAAALALAACATYHAGPVRNDALFAQIQQGMTQDQVLQIAGRPDEAMPFPLSRTLAWSYYAYDTWGYYIEQSITFDPQGRVASKYARRINDGGDHK